MEQLLKFVLSFLRWKGEDMKAGNSLFIEKEDVLDENHGNILFMDLFACACLCMSISIQTTIHLSIN